MKYFVFPSMTCAKCENYLFPHYEPVINPKHMYKIGQLYSCRCEISKCWTNSVRNPKKLLDFFDGKEKDYYSGICNDIFCGYCYRPLYPLQNGYQYKGDRYDLYGCMKCKQNQNIIVDGRHKLRENGHQPIIDWYKKHIDSFRKLAGNE